MAEGTFLQFKHSQIWLSWILVGQENKAARK